MVQPGMFADLVDSLVLVWLEPRIIHSNGLIDIDDLVWIHRVELAQS